MALSIKDPRADRLARRLAAMTGESLTEAVTKALEQRLEPLERDVSLADRRARVQQIASEVRAAIDASGAPIHSLDHGELLYDERGMPR